MVTINIIIDFDFITTSIIKAFILINIIDINIIIIAKTSSQN